MKRTALMTWPQVAALAAVITLLATAFALRQRFGPRAVTVTAGTGPEELVYVQSEDGIPTAAQSCAPPKDSAKQIAVIWIHGWGVNFYQPAYVRIGRALAGERLYMHRWAIRDGHGIGNVTYWKGDQRIRGRRLLGRGPANRCETSRRGSRLPSLADSSR